MLADILKGLVPVAVAEHLTPGDILTPAGITMLTGEIGAGFVPTAGQVAAADTEAVTRLCRATLGPAWVDA